MNYTLLPILLLTICFASKSVIAQEFWGGASYGDSEQKIKELYPNFTNHDKSENLKEIGMSSVIELQTFLAERKFNVYFYFANNRLINVNLIAERILSEAEADAFMLLMVKALNSKYGSATRIQNLQAVMEEGKAMFFEFNNNETRILLVDQHNDHNLMMQYSLSDEETERLAKLQAQKLINKTNIKELSDAL